MTGDTPSPRQRALVTGGAGFPGPHPCENLPAAGVAAEAPAADRIAARLQGRGAYGPHALGHRSPLAHPGRADDLERLHAAEGRRESRPVAPMVPAERAAGILDGPLPGPHMVADGKARAPAVVHVDGTARIPIVDRARRLPVVRTIDGFERRTALPVVVDTGPSTVRRLMAGRPRDALRCFGSAPVDLFVPGTSAIRRGKAFG
ncbi:carbamoyltransferase C-terminal domain-containing protein [Streptomyces durhamensis]|uniref:carbamoyltransferase C-terminal domain-containing protein n=1 Tax=Streptomyces durhamensis TaxID=68194 RepID=UPI0004CC9886